MTAGESAVLEVADLRTSFPGEAGPIEAVSGVSFSLHARETLVLLGESGSGKSVTARSIMGLYGRRATVSGSITIAGRSLVELDGEERRHLRGGRIALVPQDPTGALDPLRRVGGQIVEVLRAHEAVDGRRAARVRALELLDSVGIPDPARVARSYPHELSGGMKQRVAVAIAISCEPLVLIADEPTTALDVTIQSQILALFADLQRRFGMALLLVTHDVGVARVLGDRVAVMYGGRLVEVGPLAEVLDRPLHPYSEGLLASVPRPEIPRGGLTVIPGRPPAAGESVAGCAFAARCRHAVAACRAEAPPLVAVGPGRFSACPVLSPVPVAAEASR